MRFLYFYLMKDGATPDRVRGVAPDHAAYWHALGLRDYLGGPFADRSGGLISFEIASAEEAERLVADDPFVREDLLERRWVKEWSIDLGWRNGEAPRVSAPTQGGRGVTTYREDMGRAWERVNSVPAQRFETRFGTIEYADQGEGTPLLVSHGVLGSHVESFDGWWSKLPGPGFRVIAPSRFGYFGSTLPDAASPADQADAYALLLDHLAVHRAVVLAFSSGSGSALEFAGRHPKRVIGLILACCRLGGGPAIGKALKPIMRLVYGADPLFWIFKKLLPTAFSQMMGIPTGYRPASPEELQAIAASRELLFPFRPRRDGAVFDGYVSNVVADRFPFEELTVPTLVINARDDYLAPYRFAAEAASRIPGAKLVTIERGGHLFMGHDSEVREALKGFVHALT